MPGLSALTGLSGLSGLFGGGFLPSNIAGLSLWLKADAGVFEDSAKTTSATDDGDVVGAWEDQSGNSNDVLQTTTADKPLLKLNIVNSKPVIRFDGTNDDLSIGSFVAELSQPNTIFVVIEVRNLNNDAFWVFDGQDIVGSQNELRAQTATDPDIWAIIAGASLTGGDIIRDEIILIGAKYDGGDSEIKQNDVVTASGNAGTEGLDGFRIGSRRNNTSYFDGDVAEVLIYNVNLSTLERQQVEDYFNSRYVIF